MQAADTPELRSQAFLLHLLESQGFYTCLEVVFCFFAFFFTPKEILNLRGACAQRRVCVLQ